MRILPTLMAATAATLASLLSLPALAHPVTFVGSLNAAAENNPADNSLGTGTATITFDDDAFTMRVQVTFSGLLNQVGNNGRLGVTASHIHCCSPSAGSGNAGVATPVPSFPGFPTDVLAGAYDQTFNMALASSWNPAFVTANGGTVSSAFAAFSTGLNAGKSYLNIHTGVFGGGEIRAFLTAAPVPEPGTYTLMLGGLAVLGWAARQRRAQA